MTPFEDRVLMATGFAKWGMTGGTAAALLLADLVLGRANGYAAVQPQPRERCARPPRSCVKENARSACTWSATG